MLNCMRDGELTLQTTQERGSLIQLHQFTSLWMRISVSWFCSSPFLTSKIVTTRGLFQLLWIAATVSVLYKSYWIICVYSNVTAGQHNCAILCFNIVVISLNIELTKRNFSPALRRAHFSCNEIKIELRLKFNYCLVCS